MGFEHKVVIVTGGGSGFGAGIVRRFACDAGQVAIADIDADAAQRIAKETGARAYQVDVSNGDNVAEFAASVVNDMGPPDVLINNAGITHLPKPLEDITEDEFLSVFSVNCKSVYLTARHFVPMMKASGGGCILNVASTAGLSPRPRLNWYNASKGWMITATRTMAIELAPFNIRVNGLAPVAGETPLLKRFLGEDTPERREAFLSTIPLGRFCHPDDIASAARFLCSDDAGMMTGVILPIDGGRTL
ncbi:MAG: glucose 1-dehydrogenase [Paracoccaceae bacterium]|nr:glucose 1-dehydrogenase [Paracoccaceae bacterium]MDE2912464.1 glucose 1-dehydrogenase [Paracoccaceae bacterium]